MKALLELPFFYNLWRRGIARSDLNTVLVSTYARPASSQRVLDIGCGPAPILESLPRDVEYVGFDPNSAYIDSARARFGARGRFFRSTATREALADLGSLGPEAVGNCGVGALHAQPRAAATSSKRPSPRLRHSSLSPTWVTK